MMERKKELNVGISGFIEFTFVHESVGIMLAWETSIDTKEYFAPYKTQIFLLKTLQKSGCVLYSCG